MKIPLTVSDPASWRAFSPIKISVNLKKSIEKETHEIPSMVRSFLSVEKLLFPMNS